MLRGKWVGLDEYLDYWEESVFMAGWGATVLIFDVYMVKPAKTVG